MITQHTLKTKTMTNPQTPDTGSIPLEGKPCEIAKNQFDDAYRLALEKYPLLKHFRLRSLAYRMVAAEIKDKQQPPLPAKSLNEIKDEVAKIIKRLKDDDYDLVDIELRMNYLIDELFASQFKSQHNTGWVKCSERMPEEKQFCLVFNSISVEPAVYYNGEFARYPNDIKGDRCAMYHFDIDKCTHWQPLQTKPE